MKKYFFLISVVVATYICNAQNTYKYRSYKYTWETQKPEKITVEPQYANKDAVILSNEITLRIEGKGPVDSRPFHINTQYFISKSTRIKILTEKSKQEFSKINVPESFDVQYDAAQAKWSKKYNVTCPKFYDYELIYFVARIIKPNGTIINVDLTDKVESETTNTMQGNESLTSNFYSFSIKTLEMGDELEYRYEIYYPPFKYKSSNRFSLQNKYPQQKCTFDLTYNKELLLYFKNNNLQNAKYDSTIVTDNAKKYIKKNWQINNIDGYGKLDGQKSYIDQPYISFYHHRKEFSALQIQKYNEPYNSEPYTWANQYENVAMFLNLVRNSTEYANSRPYEWANQYENINAVKYFSGLGAITYDKIEFNKLYDGITKNINDSTGYQQFNYINDTICSFRYFPESSYNFYSTSKSIDSYIKTKSVREKDITEFYFEMLERFHKPFLYGHIEDNRYAEIDSKEFRPLLIGKQIIALPYKKSIVFVLPKWQQSGFKVNELPFYLQNTKAVLIPQGFYKERTDNQAYRLSDFVFINTPASNENENYRIINSNVLVLLDAGLVQFNSKINLSGQYSTLTRGLYESKSMDTTVNTMYYDPFTNVGKSTVIKDVKVGKIANNFPFKVGITGIYENSTLITKSGTNEYSFDIGNLTKHVYIKEFNAMELSNPFYPDFLNSDTYKYTFTFDKSIESANDKELCVEIKNKLGTYKRTVEKTDDKTIVFQSTLTINNSKIETEDLKDVETIFKELEKNNTLSLKIKTK